MATRRRLGWVGEWAIGPNIILLCLYTHRHTHTYSRKGRRLNHVALARALLLLFLLLRVGAGWVSRSLSSSNSSSEETRRGASTVLDGPFCFWIASLMTMTTTTTTTTTTWWSMAQGCRQRWLGLLSLTASLHCQRCDISRPDCAIDDQHSRRTTATASLALNFCYSTFEAVVSSSNFSYTVLFYYLKINRSRECAQLPLRHAIIPKVERIDSTQERRCAAEGWNE